MDYFSQDSFRAICELKHLQHLRIEDADVNVPPDMYYSQTSLRKRTLHCTHIVHQAEFNSFVQRAFPNLADMELLDLKSDNITYVGQSFDLQGHICSNIPSLQRLVVSKPTLSIMLSQFLEFCASHAPKELRFKCMDILDTPENDTLYRIPVQKLFLDSQRISPNVLQKLISSMKDLQWLEIMVTDNLPSEVISSLRKQLPRCYLKAKRTVVNGESFLRYSQVLPIIA